MLNAPEARGYLDTIPSAVAPVLPTARELADCHSEEELKHLRGVAMGLHDSVATELFVQAITERRKLEIERAFATPGEIRAKREAWEREKLSMNQQRAFMPQAGILYRGPGLDVGTPVATAFGDAQSVGPSE